MHTHKASLSNKVFTENPLLDEIVYNARQLATGVVLKDEDKANNSETVESMQNGDVLININRGVAKFSDFRYDFDILYEYYQNVETAIDYSLNNKKIPESDRDALRDMTIKRFTANFVEYNNYYRMLHGLPEYDEYGIYNGLFIDVNQIDYSIPTSLDYIHAFQVDDNYTAIHELDIAYKNMLYSNGTCENIINSETKLSELNAELNGAWELKREGLLYLMHIGDREVDYYTARAADKFALLYCPSCDSEEVKARFKELFEANRLYTLYTIYSSAYKLRSDYYDNFMMVFLVIQTIIDMIVELPEYIIRRDIFDTRTCKYIFESNGVKYFKDIPLKYQISLVKNLNKIIKFKSTDKCIVDIVSIFGVENINVFKYYILKDRNMEGYNETSTGEKTPLYYNNYKYEEDISGDFSITEDNDTNYDLKFIKVPMLGKYDDYIRSDANLYDYDTMVDGDDYWTGDKSYDSVKSDIKDLDFTVLRSKYYSIEAVIDLAKRNFTMTYFMNLIMYNKTDFTNEKIKVNLPNISTSKKFELIDTILTLFSLSYAYYGVEDTIIDTRAKAATILGFNMEADMDKIAAWLDENHKGLTLKDLRVDGFTLPAKNPVTGEPEVVSFGDLENMFFKNKDCYDVIREVMKNPPSKEIYDAYRYLYNAMLYTNRNMEYFLVDDIPIEYIDYKTKFVEIPRLRKYYCKNCFALIDFNKLINGEITVCPVCKKEIGSPYIEEHLEQDYQRDLKWFMDSTDYETLYFVIRDDFDTSHMFDLYVKQDATILKNVGSVRMAYTYRDFLKSKDATLYAYISNIVAITNVERRQEACVNAIQSIVSYLKDYITQDGDKGISLDTVFSGLPSISMDFIKKYVTEVIDFFKSFKIFTHGSSILYVIDDKFDNYVQLIEHILLKYLLDKSEVVKIEDIIEGKATIDVGKLLLKGPGLRADISPADKFKIIDKVWFAVSKMVQKFYNEYYNSGNYTQTDLRIRDICDRFNKYEYKDSVFTDHYIKELETYAVDAILRTLVEITKLETVEIKEAINLEYDQRFDEYYNEWLADISQIMATYEVSDKVPYVDDYIRSDFYNFYTVYPIIDGKQSITSTYGISDETYKLKDSYSSILTQEFPEHSFDE